MKHSSARSTLLGRELAAIAVGAVNQAIERSLIKNSQKGKEKTPNISATGGYNRPLAGSFTGESERIWESCQVERLQAIMMKWAATREHMTFVRPVKNIVKRVSRYAMLRVWRKR